jgi:hypothetical protein
MKDLLKLRETVWFVFLTLKSKSIWLNYYLLVFMLPSQRICLHFECDKIWKIPFVFFNLLYWAKILMKKNGSNNLFPRVNRCDRARIRLIKWKLKICFLYLLKDRIKSRIGKYLKHMELNFIFLKRILYTESLHAFKVNNLMLPKFHSVFFQMVWGFC